MNFQRCKQAFAYSATKFTYLIHCHVHPSSAAGAFVYTVHYCAEYSGTVFFISSSGCPEAVVIVAGTAKKRFTTQEMARRFALFEEALFVFDAQDLNIE